MHPLHHQEASRARALQGPWAAVHVRRHGEELTITGEPLFIAKTGTRVAELPDRFMVIGLDGAPVWPSPGRRFFISIESFDPVHALMEM